MKYTPPAFVQQASESEGWTDADEGAWARYRDQFEQVWGIEELEFDNRDWKHVGVWGGLLSPDFEDVDVDEPKPILKALVRLAVRLNKKSRRQAERIVDKELGLKPRDALSFDPQTREHRVIAEGRIVGRGPSEYHAALDAQSSWR